VNEASVTQDLHRVLKGLLQPAAEWDVYKVCDRITKGRPDTLITGQGYTSFLEVKLLKPGDTLRACVTGKNALQLHTMQQLWDQTAHRAWYVVYDCRKRGQRDIVLYTPAAMFAGVVPLMWEETHPGDRLAEELTAAGAVGHHGFAHGLVAMLLKETHVHKDR
jgi:hypothetical protein